MNKGQTLFQTHVQYPEEFRHYDDSDQAILMELILIKILFTLPDFTNLMHTDSNQHPKTNIEFGRYIQKMMYTHVDDTLTDLSEEFSSLSSFTVGYPEVWSNIKDDKYLTFEDHYDYMNFELAKTMSCIPNYYTTQIANQVARHLSGVVYAVWSSSTIQDRYAAFGAFDVDVILDLKNSDTIVLIYSLPETYYCKEDRYDS